MSKSFPFWIKSVIFPKAFWGYSQTTRRRFFISCAFFISFREFDDDVFVQSIICDPLHNGARRTFCRREPHVGVKSGWRVEDIRFRYIPARTTVFRLYRWGLRVFNSPVTLPWAPSPLLWFDSNRPLRNRLDRLWQFFFCVSVFFSRILFRRLDVAIAQDFLFNGPAAGYQLSVSYRIILIDEKPTTRYV